MQELFPELVTVDEDGYLAIKYTAFAPLMVELLKEQDESIIALQQENALLKEQLRAQGERLASMETQMKAVLSLVQQQ